MNTSMLEQLQGVAVNALAADPYFNGTNAANGLAVPIVSEAKAEITTQVESALAQVGICALVMTPLFEFFDEYVADLSGWAFLTVGVYENVALNQENSGTQINAIVLAQEVLAVLHHLETGLVTGPSETVPTFIGIKRPFELTNPGPPLQYTVNFMAHVRLP
jgi:hypothetical protein